MKSAVLLATVTVLATSTGQPKVSLACSDFKKLPDGAWLVVRTTTIAISNFERKTLFLFPASEGTLYPPDAKAAPPAKNDALSALTEEDMEGVDLVGELNKRCR